jgi:hypothetical protein
LCIIDCIVQVNGHPDLNLEQEFILVFNTLSHLYIMIIYYLTRDCLAYQYSTHHWLTVSYPCIRLSGITFLLGIGFALGANGVTLVARFGNPHGDVVMCGLVGTAFTLFYIAFGRIGAYVNVVCDTDLGKRMAGVKSSAKLGGGKSSANSSGNSGGGKSSGNSGVGGRNGASSVRKEVDETGVFAVATSVDGCVVATSVDGGMSYQGGAVIGEPKSSGKKAKTKRPSQTELIVN